MWWVVFQICQRKFETKSDLGGLQLCIMRSLFLILIVLLFGVGAFADNVYQTRERLTPEEFQIFPCGGWDIPFDYDYYFKDLYDCGFNLTSFIDYKYVKLAKKYKLKSVVNSFVDRSIEDYNERAKDFTKKFKSALKGNLEDVYFIYISDEPQANEKNRDELSALCDAIFSDLKCKPYVNLLPNYASNEQLGMGNYEDYLDYFTKACKLDYISYDNYAFFTDPIPDRPNISVTERGAWFDEDRFYSNLESVKAVADRNRVSFINTIQSSRFMGVPDVDKYILMVQGWSTLAYGGRGISYYTFVVPNYADCGDAAYDKYGFKTPVWTYIANMNYAIHNIGSVYKNLKNINVFHVGNVPKGCKDQSSAINVKNLNLHSVNGKANVLVGEFVDREGKQYAMVVNKNPKYSVVVDIKFNKGDKIYRVNDRSEGDLIRPCVITNYILPGEGVLFCGE